MEEFKAKRHAVKKMTRKGLVETDSREGIVKETAEAKSDGRCINEADFVCTIIWYRTQYMNYIILPSSHPPIINLPTQFLTSDSNARTMLLQPIRLLT